MTGFSHRVEQISISGIREVFEAAGEDAINLGLGQPDFPTPAHAREAAIEAIRAGEGDSYTSNKGTRALRDAIAAKHDRDNDLDVDPENVIATAGGSEALHLAMEAHVDQGEEVAGQGQLVGFAVFGFDTHRRSFDFRHVPHLRGRV